MNQARQKTKGKRRRRWLQFSIRSLLVLTVIVGAVCAWFLRPKQRERELAGGAMRVREQFLTVPISNSHQSLDVRHGRWELLDRSGRKRVKGRYEREWQHGWWTIYHDNGRKAIQGYCRYGAPVGKWKMWFVDGTQHAEYEFSLRSRPRHTDGDPLKHPGIPMLPGSSLPPVAGRSGPTRVWWPNGNLRLEGEYRDDLRHGHWTLYDSAGNKTAAGPYRKGQRHGTWTFWGGQAKPSRKLAYAYDRPLPDVDELLASNARQLDEGDLSARLVAARQLEALGPFALPVLTDALSHHEPDVRVLALRALFLLGPDVRSALPRIEDLDNDREPIKVHRNAKLAIYSIDQERRGAIVRKFLGRATIAADDERRTIVQLLGRLDRSVFPFLELALDDSDVGIRLAVIDVLTELAKRCPSFFSGPTGPGFRSLDKAQRDPDERVRSRAQPLPLRAWRSPMAGGIPVVG